MRTSASNIFVHIVSFSNADLSDRNLSFLEYFLLTIIIIMDSPSLYAIRQHKILITLINNSEVLWSNTHAGPSWYL